MSIPRPNTWTAAFVARLDNGPEGTSSADPRAASNFMGVLGLGGSVSAAAASAACCNPATDGVYVYVWEASSRKVHKVGTFFLFVRVFHPCCASHIYRASPNHFTAKSPSIIQ